MEQQLKFIYKNIKLFLLKGVFGKNERGYKLDAIKKRFYLRCVYKEKIVKNDSHRRTQRPYKFGKMQHSTRIVNKLI